MKHVIILLVAFTLLSCNAERNNPEPRPNFLLIVADDLGFTDLGAFGGEIRTPHLDAIAQNGLRLLNFHTAPACSPTRAMLLTGTDHHIVGLGATEEYLNLAAPHLRGQPGYDGYLNFSTQILPETLSAAGYRTYLTGKWHLGLEEHTSPHARGFEKTFAMLEGAAGHFDDRQLVPGTDRNTVLFRENGVLIKPPAKFYSTATYANKLIEFLEADRTDDRPFFAFLSFTAPHWPLQAPAESVSRYRGRYDQGYEVIYLERLARLKALGLVDSSFDGQPEPPGFQKWDELTPDEQRYSARLMEIYAAMIDDMDHYIGEVIAKLRELGQYENTIVIFMSDNGATGGNHVALPMFKDFITQCCDNRFENLGEANSYLVLGNEWARVSSGPFRFYKSHTTEGGIRSPAIVSYPKQASAGTYGEFLTVMDIFPTVLELARAERQPARDREILPFKGASFAAVVDGSKAPVHSPDYTVGWELHNHRALWADGWKLVMSQPPLDDGSWRLYNVRKDPYEIEDLSDAYPQKFAELLGTWQAYAEDNGVVLP